MKLYYDRKAKDPIYYVQQGYRNSEGRSTTRNIKRIGKHSELLEITDDPLEYAKQEVAKVNAELRTKKVTYEAKVDFNEKVPRGDGSASSATWVNIGYLILQYIMSGLELKEFFKDITKDRKNTFDCYTIMRFLTYARILDPQSKHATWGKMGTYFEKPDFEYQHIMRCMDILSEHYSKYIEWLFRKSNNVVERNTSVMYYDCTNFYCECESADEDYIDEVTGEYIEGLRRFGYSKEHRPNPIVEMGLFMDMRGIPISMSINPGNKNEQVTAIPMEQEILRMTDGAKFIYCADAGLGSYNIRKFNSMGGRAFIVTQSVKKLSDKLKAIVFDDNGYKLLSDGRTPMSIEVMKSFDRYDKKNLPLYNDRIYKLIPAELAIDMGLYEYKELKNGKVRKQKAKGKVDQYVIVTFSRKMMEYQRAVRKRQVERARELLKTGDPEEIKKGPNDVRRFLKRVAKAKGGEDAKVSYEMDYAKIAEEEKYDGFYAVATNLDDEAKDIIAVMEKRYKIEECFRIMKTNFNGRPVYHNKERRIRAHFMICYTALLVYRLLECKLDDQGTHVTTDDLINTLKVMNVTKVHDREYQALYTGSPALDALVRLTGMPLDRMHYLPKELKKYTKKQYS
ncbi:MAG: transposase [Mogibacterium sp.]|nr:transposase [Mogibacterium sp.]